MLIDGVSDFTILITASVCAFLAMVLFVVGFVPDKVEEDPIFGYREKKRARLLEENGLYAMSLPVIQIFAHYIRSIPDSKFDMGRRRSELREKLKRSGFMGAYTPNEYYGLICTTIVSGFVVGLLFSILITDNPQLPVAFIAAGVGGFLPSINLNAAIEKRLGEIDRRLPYSIDLLVLSMRAGLDFVTALDRVVTRGQEQDPDDPMTQELGVVLQEMRVGTARTDALINLCSRVHSDYLKSMVGAIIQSEKRGTPLAQVLEIQIGTIRNKRTQMIEKKASQAAVKILLPLMFIFGAVMVLIFGAFFIRIQAAT